MLDPKVYTALFWLNRRLMDQAPCP
jgi:hypothetical protein